MFSRIWFDFNSSGKMFLLRMLSINARNSESEIWPLTQSVIDSFIQSGKIFSLVSKAKAWPGKDSKTKSTEIPSNVVVKFRVLSPHL